jgi:hypothetical protein
LWTITAPEGFYPTITFSSFSTEPLFDYCRVYDGPNINSPLIFSQSGLLALETVTGSQSTMTVTFTSDASAVSAGVVAVVGFSEQAGTVSPPPVTDPGEGLNFFHRAHSVVLAVMVVLAMLYCCI